MYKSNFIYLYEVYVLGVQGYHLNPPSLSQLDLDLVSA